MKTDCVIKGKGFTLSELLVVIIVIAVLGAIAVPVYTKAIKRSRASDALKVLSLAAAKQEVYSLNRNGEYAATFTELAAPIKGLTGGKTAQVGHFDYILQDGCVVAKRDTDRYAIYKNFTTMEEGCVGEGCEYLQGLIPVKGAVGCEIVAIGGGDGPGAVDPCIANPDLCKGPGGVTCPAGKIYSPALNSCVCAISSCGANGVLNPDTCTCSCSGTCAGGKVMSDTCECECPSDKPYFYNNQCSVCPNGAPKADGSCCAANQCYSGGKCINKLVPDGTTTETMVCGQTGTQTRTFIEGCPGSWGAWSACECPAGKTLKNGICTGCDESQKPVTFDPCGCGGIKTRLVSCGSDGQWTAGVWSSCQNGGECTPGDTKSSPDHEYGAKGPINTCTSSCTWGPQTCPAGMVLSGAYCWTPCPETCPEGYERSSYPYVEVPGAKCCNPLPNYSIKTGAYVVNCTVSVHVSPTPSSITWCTDGKVTTRPASDPSNETSCESRSGSGRCQFTSYNDFRDYMCAGSQTTIPSVCPAGGYDSICNSKGRGYTCRTGSITSTCRQSSLNYCHNDDSGRCFVAQNSTYPMFTSNTGSFSYLQCN